jgi:hypothetical protein
MTLIPSRSAAAAAAITALLVVAPTASAAKQPAPADCGYTGTSVFSPWNDGSNYALTADGGFEAGAAGWTLDGGAAVTEGNETFQVGGADDHQSLGLPAGGSATSPAICVSKGSDDFRLFARNSGERWSRLMVEVLYTTPRGRQLTVEVDALRGGQDWAPTRTLNSALGRLLDDVDANTASVQLRFTPVGPGDWQIDDLYVDPRLRQ